MIQFLRGTQAALNSSQQIFAEGQPIYEKDTHQLKIGDGVNNYSGLPYIGSSGTKVVEAYKWGDSEYYYYYDLDDIHRVVFGTNSFPSSVGGMDEVTSGGGYTLWAGHRLSFGLLNECILPVVESVQVTFRRTLDDDDTDTMPPVHFFMPEVLISKTSAGNVLISTSPMAITEEGTSPNTRPYKEANLDFTIYCRRE